MPELYIFSPEDELLTIVTEDTGLVSAPVRIEVNSVPDTPFSFTVEADSENAQYVKEENKVVYRDHEGDLRIAVIKELDDTDSIDGPETTATCEPEFMELAEHIVVDRRMVDDTADVALDAVLEGTRYVGEVEVDLGLATTNFYYIDSVEGIWKIIGTWGGEFKDVVEFDEQNNIIARKIKIIQRLGKDTGQRFEIDHNITEIGRTVLSYPLTAMYGRGASLETEGGGHTRYIDFADVEWKKSNGDPVDKPLGQKWVGDPEALQTYGRLHNGKLLHREGIFSNQDYEDQEELLWATWQNLQENKYPEVNYRLSIDLFNDKVSLGDTAIAIDRMFARPIEIQARIIAMEYDLVDIDGTMVVEMGQFLSIDDDRLDNVINEVERIKERPSRVTENSYPDRKPSRPVNVRAKGAFETIQLYWDYADELFIKHYEVYGSQVADFVPDSQHLLWRGQVSAFAHTVETDQTWYYYVRAVNYHGTPSDWSVKVSASTQRIISEDILFGEDIAQELRDLNRISDIIGKDGVSLENLHQEIPDYMKQQANEYTDAEVKATRNELLADIADKAGLEYVNGELTLINSELADKAGLEYVNGQLRLKADSDVVQRIDSTVSGLQGTTADLLQSVSDHEEELADNGGRLTSVETNIDTIKGDLSATITDLSTLDGIVSRQRTDIDANSEALRFKASQDELDTVSGNVSDLSGELNVLAGEVSLKAEQSTVEGLRTDFENLEVGGRNYFVISDAKENKVLAWADARELTEPGSLVSGFIPISVGKKIVSNFSLSQVFFYNSNKEYIGAETSVTTIPNESADYRYKPDNTPEDTVPAFMRVGFRNDFLSSHSKEEVIVQKGNKLTDWTPAPEDYEAEFQSVNRKVSDLTVSVEGIEGSVSSLSKSVSDHGVEISDLSSNYTQLAGLVESKVDSSEYNTDINGIVSDLESQSSLIRQQADKIESKVDATYVQGAIDGVQIGGRNLLKDTSSEWTTVSHSQYYTNLKGRLYLTGLDLEEGDTITFRVYVKTGSIAGARARLRFHDFDGNNHQNAFGTEIGKETEGWIEVTAEIPNNTRDFFVAINAEDNGSETGTFDYKYAQLEKGNKATDWTPAPEDIDSRISTAESTIEQHADLIRSKVEKDEFDSVTGALSSSVSIITQRVGIIESEVRSLDGIGDAMSEAQSSIKQLSNEIEFKVDVDGIVTSMNLNEQGARISGDLIHLDGLTLIEDGIIDTAHIANGAISRAKLGTAVVDTAQIANAAITNAKVKSINADKVNATSLSAISANLGTVTAGRLLSDNNNMDLNLNTGALTMRNADFTLGNGANINFTDVGNRITYRHYDSSAGFNRSSGLGVGLVRGGTYPFAYLGTNGSSNLDTLSQYYTGFMAMPSAYIAKGAANSVTGWRFEMRNTAVNWNKGIEYDFNGTPTIRPFSHADYDIGTTNYRFRRLYVNSIRTYPTLFITNTGANRGFAIDTDYTDGHNPAIYGQYPEDNYYNLGRDWGPFSYAYITSVYADYLRGELQGSSARKFKKNEGKMNLADSLEFIRNAEIVTFDWIRDENLKINKDNPQTLYDKQVGFILDDLKMENDYLVKRNEETIKKDNIIFMHQQVIQNNLTRLDDHDDELTWLKTENQLLKNKIKILKEKIT